MDNPNNAHPTPTVAAAQFQPTPQAFRRFNRFSVRGGGFQLACVGGLLAFLLFVIGFISPAWFNDQGLWMACKRDGTCFSTGSGPIPSWYEFVRFLECLALICFVLAVSVEVYQDLYKTPPPPDNKAVEILGALAGVTGLLGIVILAGKLLDNAYHKPEWQWGFGMATAGCALVLLCSFVVAISRKASRAHTEAAMALAGFPVRGNETEPPQRDMYGYDNMGSQPQHPQFHPISGPPTYPPAAAPSLSHHPQQRFAPSAFTSPPTQNLPTSEVPAYVMTHDGKMVAVPREPAGNNMQWSQ